MAMLDQESLFSLEIVVAQITFTSKDVCCRFPAVAFRLLDFPTLMVYHVEPGLGQAIKRKINVDAQVAVPQQLVDLQDKDGIYQVKKGKSCLFKVPPKVLQSHLQNTPFYVMVIDTYPATPKLVGNCTVPLDIPMNSIYNDIRREGISKPISYGEKGTYKLYNLMGAVVGQVTFGFRILSLGVGLISHIPDQSVGRMKKSSIKKSASARQVSPRSIEQEATELILEDLKTADQKIQVVLSAPRPDVNVHETQTDMNLPKVASTQTEDRKEGKGLNLVDKSSIEEVKKKKLKKEEKRLNSVDNLNTLAQITPPCDDIIITNTVCPPALFYNSKADPPYIAPGLTLDDYLVHKQKDAMKIDSDTESVDSDSTIRPEDRFSETEVEIKRPSVKTVYEYPLEPTKQQKKPDKRGISVDGMMAYPLLSALMSEIASLQCQGVGQGVRTGNIAGERGMSQKSRSVTQLQSSPSKKSLRPVSPTRTYMLRKAMSAALADKPFDEPCSPIPLSHRTTPDQIHSTPSGPLSKKVQPAKLKKQRTMSAKQKFEGTFSSSAALMPGMTKSQRLRLQKTNPELLEKLEKEEKERVEKFKAKRIAMGAGFYRSSTGDHAADSDQYDQFKRKVPNLQLNGQRKPVPTPRTSVHEDHIIVREVPPVVPRKSKHRAKREQVESEEYDDDEAGESEREVIDVHMPSARMDDTDDSELEEVHKPKQDRILGQTYSSVTSKTEIPKQSAKSQAHAYGKQNDPFGENSSAGNLGAFCSEPEVQHSKDQNDLKVSGADAGEALGLQRLVDVYPDEEQSEDAVMGRHPGEELGLKQVIDRYSDEEDEEETDSSSTHSQLYHSAKSDDFQFEESAKSKPDLKIATSLVKTVAPSASNMSPSIASKPSLSARNPMTESLSTVTESNPDSTAYIHRSEMTNSQFSSIESTGPAAGEFQMARKSSRKPFASPRKSLERIHTESVSSYAPSDPDMVPLSPTAEYSDEFDEYEENDVVNVKYMKDAKVAPESRFGYTWSGS